MPIRIEVEVEDNLEIGQAMDYTRLAMKMYFDKVKSIRVSSIIEFKEPPCQEQST